MLEQQIQEDIKAAMKAKDTVALAATRAIKGEILLFKTSEGGSKEVTDGDILKMIQEKYLPKQLSAEEVKAKVREIIAQVGATSIKDMGKVMGAANKALAGQSDGRTISAAVKEVEIVKGCGTS